MKCEQCGASLTLADEFCPYCGALNKAARQHIEDMKRYNKDYEATKEEVLDHARKQSQSHTKIIVIALLVLANVLLFGLRSNSYMIEEFLTERRIDSHADEYAQILSAYEEAGNYEELYVFYSRNWLYYSDKLREYNLISDMSRAYTLICKSLYFLYNEDAKSYYSQSEHVQYVAQYTAYFFEYLSYQNSSYYQASFTEEHMKTFNAMRTDIESYLKAYAKLTDEDIEKLPDLSSQDLLVLIGRRLGIYE